jgi:Holliday junction resolvase RusA-like endonuclease
LDVGINVGEKVQSAQEITEVEMLLRFVIPGIPVAQPRQRHRVVQMHGKAMAMNYTPARDPVNAFKAAAKFAAAEAYQGEPLNVPVSVLVRFVFPRPASVPKKAGTERMPHLGRPDVDNLFKSLADALNGQLWLDDSRVYQANLNKFKAAAGEQPHTEVLVKWGE